MLWNCGSLRSFFGSRDPLSLLFLRLAYDRLTYDACRIINIATRRSTLVRLGGSLLGGYLWTYFVLSGANSIYLWILIRREVEIAILKNYEILPLELKNYSKRRWSSRLSTYLRTTVRGRPVLDLWFIYRHFSSLRYRRGRKSRRINRSMAACAITIEIKSKRGKDSLSFLDNSHLASLLSSLFTINFLSVSLSLRFSDAETRGGERKPSLCRTGAA